MATIIELATRRRPRERPSSKWSGHDLWWLGALLWVTSAARVSLGFAEHEVFGAEGTLAMLCVVWIPWVLWGEARSSRTR